METNVTYKYLAAGAHSSGAEKAAAETIDTHNFGAGQEPPSYEVGQIIEMRDKRRADRAERRFEVVDIRNPSSLTGWSDVSEHPTFTSIEVFVADA